MEFPTRPRFNNEFNFGHVLTALGLMIAIGGGYVANAREFAQLQTRLATLEKNFDVRTQQIESAAAVRFKQIDSDSAARVSQYAPQIAALNKSQDLQDERIANIVASTRDMRSSISDLVKVSADIERSVAVIRFQLTGQAKSVQ